MPDVHYRKFAATVRDTALKVSDDGNLETGDDVNDAWLREIRAQAGT